MAIKTAQWTNANLRQPFFAYAEVLIVAANAPEIEGNPTVVCELIGTNQLVIMPITENMGEMLQKTRWLILGVDYKGSRMRARGLERPPMAVIYPLNMMAEPKPE